MEKHFTRVIVTGYGAARWKCSCGQGSGGRWFPSSEEARKRADAHMRRFSNGS